MHIQLTSFDICMYISASEFHIVIYLHTSANKYFPPQRQRVPFPNPIFPIASGAFLWLLFLFHLALTVVEKREKR